MSMRLLVFASLVAFAACDGAASSDSDATVPRDVAAPVLDGSGLLDAGSGRLDAGPSHVDAGVSLCQVGACDPLFPGGCGARLCVLWGEASSCEDTPGTYSAGTPCETTMDCAPGLACFRTREGGGECGRICCPEADACTDGAVCGGSGVLVDGTATSWGWCLPPRTCDVLRHDEVCEEREGCYIVDAEGHTECRVAGTGGPGDPCEAQEDCQPGFFCGGIESTRGRCVRICRLGADDCPPAEGRCVAQRHSPDGTGFCTIDAATARR